MNSLANHVPETVLLASWFKKNGINRWLITDAFMSFKNASFNLSDAESKYYSTNFTKLSLCDNYVK